MKNVIVISAHPDDEILGAGGTILRHKKEGDKVGWLIVTNIFEHQGFSAERVISRQAEINMVASNCGFDAVWKLDYPTMSLSGRSLIDMVPRISKIFSDFEVNTVYTMNRSDAHSDHRIIFDAVAACTKSFRYPHLREFLMYETLSETEFAPALPEKMFIPNHFVDITPYLEKKLEVMSIYESELGSHPFPRSAENLRALAHYRGASAGVPYAEAFQIVKSIIC